MNEVRDQPGGAGDQVLLIAEVLEGVGYEYGDDVSQFVDCLVSDDGARTTVEVHDMDGGLHFTTTVDGAHDLDSLLAGGNIDVV